MNFIGISFGELDGVDILDLGDNFCGSMVGSEFIGPTRDIFLVDEVGAVKLVFLNDFDGSSFDDSGCNGEGRTSDDLRVFDERRPLGYVPEEDASRDDSAVSARSIRDDRLLDSGLCGDFASEGGARLGGGEVVGVLLSGRTSDWASAILKIYTR